MTSKSLRAVIFDFDGVLADTVPLHFRSFHELFAAEGVDFTFDDYQEFANGAPRARTIRTVMGDDLDPEKFESLMRRKEEIVLELADREGIGAIPGAIDLVRAFKKHGLRLGMASSSRTAVLFLEKMGAAPLFDGTTDASEVPKAKPDPDVFLRTAEKIAVDPQHCLVVEDSVFGVQAGRAAGMKVLGVTTTTTAHALRDADWVVETFEGLEPSILLGELLS
jgi:beta-phosphoglucomutase family hydrolase